MDYIDIIALIDTMPDNQAAEALAEAIEYWCSSREILQGMKDTLIYSIREQYEKFPDDQDREQLSTLALILKLKK